MMALNRPRGMPMVTIRKHLIDVLPAHPAPVIHMTGPRLGAWANRWQWAW
jgi:hypothetical protein